ncbi:MAG: hypothetical protein WC668_04110 [Patescibacteria group bacterium]|jgi:hypothetical protein
MKYWFVSYAIFREHFDQDFNNTFLASEKEYFPIVEATREIGNSHNGGIRNNSTRIVILFFQEISEESFKEGL